MSRARTAALVSAALIFGMATNSVAQAQTRPSEIAQERASIAAERRDADADAKRRLDACHKLFLETSCVNAVKVEHRQLRNQLQTRESAINLIERKQHAAARLATIEKQQGETGVTARDAAAAARRDAGNARAEKDKALTEGAAQADEANNASNAADAAAGNARQRRAEARCPAGRERTATGCVSSTKAAEQVESQKRRLADAEEHRENVARRNAQRNPAKAAQPLPLPQGVSSGSSAPK